MDERIIKRSFWTILIKNKFSFAFYFVGVFFVFFAVLYVAGFIPSELMVVNVSEKITENLIPQIQDKPKGEEPVRIIISEIGVDSIVVNPKTTDTDKLFGELKKGVVRYPESGLAGKGNMLLFGHSAGNLIVMNPAYTVFSKIYTLKKGSKILVQSQNKKYVYSVFNVYLSNANEALIKFSGGKNMITLSTCNHGVKEERYVVEANLISSSNL